MTFIRLLTLVSVLAVIGLTAPSIFAESDQALSETIAFIPAESAALSEALPACRLNGQFPPVSPRFGPLSELLKVVDPTSPKAPYSGAWEGQVKGEWVRLIILTQSDFGDLIHYSYESLDDGQKGFRPTTINPDGLSWTSKSKTLTVNSTPDPSVLKLKIDGESPIDLRACSLT